MMTARDATIDYWLDRTSDYADPRWVVSREDASGSTTLRVLEAGATEQDARIVAERIRLAADADAE